MCNKRFLSTGIGNRRCPKCELKITKAADGTYYVPPVYGRMVDSNIKVNSENNQGVWNVTDEFVCEDNYGTEIFPQKKRWFA